MQVNGQFHVPTALRPETHTIHHGGLLGPRAGLEDLEERKISIP
jgi:hypothetical protein